MMNIWLYSLLYLVVHPKTVFTYRSLRSASRYNTEEFGFALIGHDYKSVFADHFSHCFFKCSLEERCQSVTYFGDKKECKMNNETKESRPDDCVENPAATYKENTFRGIVKHLLHELS